jgi:hypothetical protein
VPIVVSKKPKPISLEQTTQSGCGDLLEVSLFAPQGAHEQDFLLGADVRFGTMLLSSEDWSKSVEIGLSRATLSLDFAGCEIDPSAHRFGDKKPTSTKTHVQHTQVTTATTHMGANASIGVRAKATKPPDADAAIKVGGGATRDAKVSSMETQVVDTREEPVVAMSNNRWRFRAVRSCWAWNSRSI